MKTLNEGDTLYESKYDAFTQLYKVQIDIVKAEIFGSIAVALMLVAMFGEAA